MLRVRFHANEEDWRPVKFPPPAPCWCTGYGDGHSIVVAYVETEDQVTEFWPEATNIDVHEENTEVRFSDRFPKPDWWTAD
jgi:hypothetical protein